MQPRTIGSMATIKSRSDTLEAVIDSIADQLSVLYIYFNDHSVLPGYILKKPNVIAILGSDASGDLNANGKMCFLEYEAEGIAFTLDDDIIYPPNYIVKFLDQMRKYNYRACLSVHGSIIPDNASWYYERKWTYAMKHEAQKSNIVNIVGSGTSAFPVEIFNGYDHDFKHLVYVDLQISLAALHHGLPLAVIDRQENWIKTIAYDGLWEKFSKVTTHHSIILRKNTHWQSAEVRKIWKNVFNELRNNGIGDPGRYLMLSQESIGFVNGEGFASAEDDMVSLKKTADFVNIWCDR